MLDDELEVNLIFFKKKMEVIKEEATWPNLILSHIKSLLLYIY